MPRDWIDTYLEFTEQFEPPRAYQLWCAILALGVAAGHKVWLEQANTKIWPNLYVVLVGPPGIGKGQAMREVLPFLDLTQVARSPDMVTFPRMIEQMGESQLFMSDGTEITPYCIWAEEFSSFLGLDAWKTGKLSDLSNLFDVPPDGKTFQSQTKNNGRVEIVNPYVCLIAGTTPSDIYQVLPPASVGQGFTSRVIFVWADKNNRLVPMKPWTPRHKVLQDELRFGIEQISKVEGAMKMDMYAWTYYCDYYLNRVDLAAQEGDARLANFARRVPFYIQKVSVLMKLSEQTPGMEIEGHHVERAAQAVLEIQQNLKIVYQEIAPDMAVRFYPKVVKFLYDRGGNQVAHTEIAQRFSHELNRRDLNETLMGLVEMGAIMEDRLLAKNGRVRRVYTLTQKARQLI